MYKNVKINPFNILQKKHEVSLPQSIFSEDNSLFIN